MDTDALIEQAPRTARQQMTELLAEIRTSSDTPLPDTARHRPAWLIGKEEKLYITAMQLFARHFLPLVVPGEWQFSRSLQPGYPAGRADRLHSILDHVRMFRRKGTNGRFNPADMIAVSMPYRSNVDTTAFHGKSAPFEFNGDARQRFTLAADCRLDSLSWHYPGETELIVLAAPELLAAEGAWP